MSEKLCPILNADSGENGAWASPCLGKHCQFWVKSQSTCAIKVIALEMLKQHPTIECPQHIYGAGFDSCPVMLSDNKEKK